MKDMYALHFPYHIGNELRMCSGALLYHGHIAGSFPAWASGGPIDVLIKCLKYADDKNHKFLECLKDIYQQFDRTQIEAINVYESLSGLEGRLQKILIVNPGTESSYENIRTLSINEEMLAKTKNALKHTGLKNTATTELMFRLYELYLEYDGNIELCLNSISSVCDSLGGYNNLLVESLIHKLTLSAPNLHGFGILKYITDSELLIELISEISPIDNEIEEMVTEAKIESLSFLMFDSVIRNTIPELNNKSSKKIARVFNKREELLNNFKEKCNSEALDLVYNCSNAKHLELKTKEVIKSFERNSADIMELDVMTNRMLFNRLTENPVVWTTLAGTAGSIISGLSPGITASLGISTLSILGTSALKSKRERDLKLKNSPWSLVYYLK